MRFVNWNQVQPFGVAFLSAALFLVLPFARYAAAQPSCTVVYRPSQNLNQVSPTPVPVASYSRTPSSPTATTHVITCTSCNPSPSTAPNNVYSIENCDTVICDGESSCKDVRIRDSKFVECRKGSGPTAACQGRGAPTYSIQTTCLRCNPTTSCQPSNTPTPNNPLRYSYGNGNGPTIQTIGPATQFADGYVLGQPTFPADQCKAVGPSSKPSSKPSVRPSLKPSSRPSLKPSSRPSSRPSLSARPSVKPSNKPSQSPSSKPSSKPSQSPSSKPSSKPSQSPSNVPSFVPSHSPSAKPSVSAKPSLSPSSSPSESAEPSYVPSSVPSKVPSTSPSAKPSAKPSESVKPSSKPSSRPSKIPSQAPSGAPSFATIPTVTTPKKSFCFSAANTVFVKGKGVISMDALKVGDLVQTQYNDRMFSPVLSFMHIDHMAEVEYLQFFLQYQESPLEVTKDHLLIGDNEIVVRAKGVKVGDILSGSKVINILTVKRQGLYAPLTESGTILVSGVLASCYVDLFSIAGPSVQAHFSHAALTPLRFMCALNFSFCENETHSLDGYSSNMLTMAQVGVHLSTWNEALQLLVLILVSPILAFFVALESIVWKPMLLAAMSFVGGGFIVFTGMMKFTGLKTK